MDGRTANDAPAPEPLPWQEARAIAARTALDWQQRYGEDGLRVILRALQRLTTGRKRSGESD